MNQNSRRNFLENIVNSAKKITAVGALSLATACGGGGGSNPVGPSTPPPAQNVTLNFRTYNHMKGEIQGGDFTINTTSGSDVALNNTNVKQTPTTDAQRIIVYEDNGSTLQNRVAFTNTGQATFKAPSTNKNYLVFRVENPGAADGFSYSCVDEELSRLPLGAPRHASLKIALPGEAVGPHTAIDGSRELLSQAVSDVNNALNPFGIRYGTLNQTEGSSNIKFGLVNVTGVNWMGQNIPGQWGVVNYPNTKVPSAIYGYAVEEAFEPYTGVDDICSTGASVAVLIKRFSTELSEGGKKVIPYLVLASPK